MLGRLGCNGFDCITKLPGLPAQVENVLEWVRSQVAQALLDLRQDRLYGMLLHRPTDLLGPYGSELARALRLVQEELNIQKLGISVYEPKELLDCWQVLPYHMVQIPCSVFDQRFTSGPAAAHLESNDIEVHARSVFLQGLLLMQAKARPDYFNSWINVFHAWADLIERSQKSALEVCMSFASQQHFIHKWVIGVDSEEHLVDLLNVDEPIDREFVPSDWAPFRDLPLDLISPARWSLQ